MSLIQKSVIERDACHFNVFSHGGKLEIKAWEDNAGNSLFDLGSGRPDQTLELIDPACHAEPDRIEQVIRITFENDPNHVAFTLPFEAATSWERSW